jgi:hypothetical protein
MKERKDVDILMLSISKIDKNKGSESYLIPLVNKLIVRLWNISLS